MCGLFGVIKVAERGSESELDPSLNRANSTLAFAYLGYRAMERGRDAAGLALFRGRLQQAPATAPDPSVLTTRRNLALDGWVVSRRGYRFSKLWQNYHYREAAKQAKILIGHTRQSTIGAKTALPNTSPLVVGNLIGTHNGGVAMRHLIADWHLDRASEALAIGNNKANDSNTNRIFNGLGQTSSEIIFRALNQCYEPSLPQPPTNLNFSRSDLIGYGEGVGIHTVTSPNRSAQLDQVVQVLESLRGRAALVWVNRAEPKVVYLARTALSPLSVAWDRGGNFYWASNYHWFEDLDAQTGDFFGFNSVQRLREGTLMVVKPGSGAKYGLKTIRTEQRTELAVAEVRHFQPFARISDWKLEAGKRMWQGFTTDDIEWEQANSIYKVKERSWS